MKIVFTSLCIVLTVFSTTIKAQNKDKNRVIILSDIEADPDDTQSFVRLFLYSNTLDIKGIVATTSCWKQSSIAPESIKKIINAYGEIQPNLLHHEAGFPDEPNLLSLVRDGFPMYGMKGVGEKKDSPGSELIIKELEAKDSRPLWICAWGGANTLAQALYKLEKTKSKDELKKLIAKLRIYAISDQDDSGVWMRNHFLDLFYIVSPGDNYASATWTGINSFIEGINNETISNSWIAKNIQIGHGALGAIYPDVAWGVEGDTPSFMNLIPNGLSNPEHPEWGGWGGRYELFKPDVKNIKKGGSIVKLEQEAREIWTDTKDKYSPYIVNEYGRATKRNSISFYDHKTTLWRWRDDFQNDFGARMDWCTKSYREANHPPIPRIKSLEEITVKSGQGLHLDASNSSDPDGDNLSFLWFHYPEAGTYKKEIIMSPENSWSVYVTAPIVDKRETLHFILKVTDKGTPPLSRYKRIIVTVLP